MIISAFAWSNNVLKSIHLQLIILSLTLWRTYCSLPLPKSQSYRTPGTEEASPRVQRHRRWRSGLQAGERGERLLNTELRRNFLRVSCKYSPQLQSDIWEKCPPFLLTCSFPSLRRTRTGPSCRLNSVILGLTFLKAQYCEMCFDIEWMKFEKGNWHKSLVQDFSQPIANMITWPREYFTSLKIKQRNFSE